MHKYLTTLITLIVAALAAIQTQAAELESQLLGYWQPDMAKTVELAKKEKREIDPMMQAIMGKLVFEFQKDKMMVHAPPGMKSNSQPDSYVVSGVDKATNSLTLSVNDKTMKASFQEAQLVLNDPKMGMTIFNRMSNEDFAKRQSKKSKKTGIKDNTSGGGKETAVVNLEDVSAQPISDKPAVGKINGKEFKVEKATLKQGSILELRQGKGFFADMEFMIFLFTEKGDNFDGKKFAVKPNQKSGNPHIHRAFKAENEDLPKTEIFSHKYTMYLEFAASKH